MNDVATNGTKKARELTSISIIMEGWDGATTTTDKRVGPTGEAKAKYSITIPVPTTEEDAQKFYNCDLASLVEAGVIQKWYGAREVDKVIEEIYTGSENPESDAAMAKVQAAVNSTRFEKTIRKSASKEMKALASELKGLNMSPAEAMALIKKIKAGQPA